jgi:hypothetical protein
MRIRDIERQTLIEREQSTVNTRGRVIAGSPEAIERFWAWFGRSKVKDRQGRPLMVYHGTTGVFRSFDPERSNSHTNTGVPHSTFAFSDNPEVAVSYITADADKTDFAKPEYRDEFYRLIKTGSFEEQMQFLADHPVMPAPEYKPGGQVLPVYLRLVKPLVVDAKGYHWNDIYFQPKDYRAPESFTTNELAEYAHDNGYDGLIVKNVKDVHKGTAHQATVYCAFSPAQIKSAIANSGQYRADAHEIDEDQSSSVGRTNS